MAHRISVMFLLLFLFLALPVGSSLGQTSSYSSDSQCLFAMARDLWAPVELQSINYADMQLDPAESDRRLREACLLLHAAVQMDPSNAQAWCDLMTLLSSPVIDDPGRATDALVQYSQLKPNDNAPIDSWISYQLDSFNERKEREYFLSKNLPMLQKYPYVQSKAMTQLAILTFEKGAIDEARNLFSQALSISGYNFDALARMLNLPPASQVFQEGTPPETIEAGKRYVAENRKILAVILRRMQLRANPYDLQATLHLIDILEGYGCGKMAQKYYEHAYKLLELQSGPPGVKEELRLKQLVGSYNLEQYQLCVRLAEDYLLSRPDDLLVNGVLALVMKKLEKHNEASYILNQAIKKAIDKLGQDQQIAPALRAELAWFFCFINPDPAGALEYAQSAYRDSDQDARVRNILAYAHVMNNQWDQGEALLTNSDPNDPIAAMTAVEILLSRNEQAGALARLKAVDVNRAGILTEKIKQKLQELEPKLEPVLSPEETTPAIPGQNNVAITPPEAMEDRMESSLNREFDDKELSLPESPENYIHCQMKLETDSFNYDDPIIGQIYLTNISDTTLFVGSGSFLDPHVLITAEVEAPGTGDTGEEMPLSHRHLVQDQIFPPSQSNSVVEHLNIGRLREILQKHPQQTYQVTFHLYLDPVIHSPGKITGRIPQLQPEPIAIVRKSFVPSQDRLSVQQQFLRTGSTNKRIQSARLMSGLLHEAELSQKNLLDYLPRKIDSYSIRELITDNLNNSAFRVRAWSAYSFRGLSLSASSTAAQRLGELLSDPEWFVRFMSVYSLEPIADLTEYLNWVSTIDENELVNRQAKLQLQQPWEVIEIPLDIPEEDPTKIDKSSDDLWMEIY
ncbi:MAG: hypothetical protein E4G91_05095 [Candidatus Zixiibacteriota bacterium]|nr:MAG: hypothetical protein E4G91_05095 [candidate division Zixibacteria bacterium]